MGGIDLADQRRSDRTVDDERIADFVADAFVVGEIKPFALDDRTADGCAELVKEERGSGFRRRVVVIAGVKGTVAMEIVGGAVQLVGTGLEADVDDNAGLGAEVGAGLLLRSEFLDSVERQGAGGRAGDAGIIDDGLPVVS